MSGVPAPSLVGAAFHLAPLLAWGVIAYAYWSLLRTRHPPGTLFRLLPMLTGLQALHYFLHVIVELTPTELDGSAAGLHAALAVVMTLSVVGSIALFRHAVRFVGVREEPPSRRWLAVNYGLVGVAGFLEMLALPLRPPATPALALVANSALLVGAALFGLALYRLFRLGRRGGLPHFFDAVDVVLPATFVGVLAVLGIAAALGLGQVLAPVAGVNPSGFSHLPHIALGLALAVPFALPALGIVLRELAVATTMVGTAVLVVFAVPGWAGRVASPEVRGLLEVAAVVVLLALFGPGRDWLHATIDRVAFRHGRRCRQELQGFLRTLSPELGAAECARRALAEVVRVSPPLGAAILLARGRGTAAWGDLDVARIERVWPEGAAAEALPARAFGFYEIREPALREVLAATRVAVVVPIVSPRERWGDLFVAEGMLGQTSDEQHVAALETFAAQLALVLDGAELLERAVAVERSLAHAEKLAATGELAARIAHEIRNPVTAARSLAQQLARDPASPLNAEHAALILAELERVERQVRGLLQFARRESFRFEPVDLGELVRTTLSEVRSRLEAAEVEVVLEAAAELVVRGDREKLRQVLVNVLENALDALADAPAPRRVGLRLARMDGRATLRVADSGPGVPADALAHLFDPFFSLKPEGTGLGLAIAKRMVDAHGGRITARGASGTGLVLDIELPIARVR